MSTNKKPNNNPTYGHQGADIPVLIYLSKEELNAIGALAKMLHQQFKSQGQNKFLKSPDIREFVKFATLTYYNMVVMSIREQEKQQKKQQITAPQKQQPSIEEEQSEYTKYV